MIQSYQFHNSVRDLYAVSPNRDIANTLSTIGARKELGLCFYPSLNMDFSLEQNPRVTIVHVSLPQGEIVDDYFSKISHRSNAFRNVADIPASMIQTIVI